MSQHKQLGSISGSASLDTMVEPEATVLPPKEEVEVKEEQPEPPPNGGWFAWLQVAGSFFLFFNCWYVLQPESQRPAVKFLTH